MEISLSNSITVIATLVFCWMIFSLATPALNRRAGKTERSDADPDLKAFALDILEKRGEHFSVRDFLYGANEARRVILNDFAHGDRDGLRPLVTPEVFDAFCQAIDDRASRNETLEISLADKTTAHIAEAKAVADCSEITVVFDGSKTETLHTLNGRERRWPSSEQVDCWTFRRAQRAQQQGWCAAVIGTMTRNELSQKPGATNLVETGQ